MTQKEVFIKASYLKPHVLPTRLKDFRTCNVFYTATRATIEWLANSFAIMVKIEGILDLYEHKSTKKNLTHPILLRTKA